MPNLLISSLHNWSKLPSRQLIVELLSPPMRAIVIFTTSAAMPHIGPRFRGEKRDANDDYLKRAFRQRDLHDDSPDLYGNSATAQKAELRPREPQRSLTATKVTCWRLPVCLGIGVPSGHFRTYSCSSSVFFQVAIPGRNLPGRKTQ